MKHKITTGLIAAAVSAAMSFSVIVSNVSAAVLPLSAVSVSDISVAETDSQNAQVEEFVTRLYNVTLDRAPDAAGLSTWVNGLVSDKTTGVSVAYGFIFSQEFQNKGCSNEEYVELMYNAFMGRASDPAGKANWVNQMNNGMTRQELFKGFANSTEFFNLCRSYGITAGTYILGRDYNKTAQVNLFVERLYEVILGRSCDQTGMNSWTNKLVSGSVTGGKAAYGFFFSQEYLGKNKSEEDYVEDLYMAFLGRGSDASGKSNWISKCYNGSRMIAFNGFVRSQEFSGLCSSYGITAGGKVWAPAAEAMNDGFTDYCFSLVDMSTIAESYDCYVRGNVYIPYVLGGESFSGFDCSGLQVYIYRNYFHKEIPHYAQAQEYLGTAISASQIRPGDLLADHEYAGHGGAIIYAGKAEDGRDIAIRDGWGNYIRIVYVDLSDYIIRRVD